MSSEVTSSLAREMERRVRPRLIQTSRTEGNEAPASDRYDFAGLVQSSPELAPWILPHRDGGETIDFRDPSAVIALNRALLKFHYGVQWDLPDGRLCPTIPSRADYLDQIARLLNEDSPDQRAPSGERVRILDVGVGANAVYPLIGHAKHGWRFVGTEIDRESCEWARQLVRVNRVASTAIEIREQPLAEDILTGAISANERFHAAICNPPFYDSKAGADATILPHRIPKSPRADSPEDRESGV
jgi:23S rRNA (adenine1618-N6)-methyltransferase